MVWGGWGNSTRARGRTDEDLTAAQRVRGCQLRGRLWVADHRFDPGRQKLAKALVFLLVLKRVVEQVNLRVFLRDQVFDKLRAVGDVSGHGGRGGLVVPGRTPGRGALKDEELLGDFGDFGDELDRGGSSADYPDDPASQIGLRPPLRAVE